MSTSLVLLAVYIANNAEYFLSDSTSAYYKFVTGLIFQHIILAIRENWFIALILMGIAMVLVFIRERFKDMYLLYTVLKYVFRTTFFSLLFYYATGNAHLIPGYVACAVVFVFCDYVRRLYENLVDTGGIRWFGLLSLVLFVLMFFNNRIYVDLATFNGQMLLAVFGKWYTALFLMAVTVGAYVITHCFLDTYRAETTFEEMTYISLASSLLVVFSAGCFYVGYSWLVLAAYFVAMCIYLSNNGPRPGKYEAFKQDMRNYLTLPLMAVGVSLCIIDGHFGKFFVALAFVASVALGFLLQKKIRRISDKGVRNSWMYTAILSLVYINTAVRLWTFHFSAYLVIIMGVVCAALIAIIWVANYNPQVYLDNKYLEKFQYAVPALFVVICLVVFAHGGSTVKIDLDGLDNATVDAEAHGDDNGVESLSYVWVVDSETLKNSVEGKKDSAEDKIKDTEESEKVEDSEETKDSDDKSNEEEEAKAHGYTDINSGDEIALRSGLLKIVCEDENGIKTTVKRWCYVPEEPVTPYELPKIPE